MSLAVLLTYDIPLLVTPTFHHKMGNERCVLLSTLCIQSLNNQHSIISKQQQKCQQNLSSLEN